MKRAVWAVLLVGLVAGAEDKKDDPLKGTWVVVTMVRNGQSNENAVGDKVTFEDGTMTIRGKNRENKGAYKLDASKDPKQVDITPSDGLDKGMAHVGIYALDKGELKLCIGRPGKDRPTAFESKEGSEHMLVKLKRQE